MGVSPYSQVPQIPAVDLDAKPLAALTGIAFGAVGVAAFGKRDGG